MRRQPLSLPRPLLLVQWHVLREVLLTFVVALVTVTTVIVLAAAVISLRGMPGVQLSAIFMVLPVLGAPMLVYTVPLTLLFAVIWTFSRLQQDNEIMALRSCGVHLHTITSPVVLLGVLVAGAMLTLFDQVIPLAHQQKSSMLKRGIASVLEGISRGDGNRISMENYEIFIGGVGDGGLKDVVVYVLASGREMRPEHRFVAPRAEVSLTEQNTAVLLQLFEGEDIILESADSARDEKASRRFGSFTFELPLGSDELERAQTLVAGKSAGVREVRFAAGTLELGADAGPGQLSDVRLTTSPEPTRYSCRRVRARVLTDSASPRLDVELLHASSARWRSRSGWQHVFHRNFTRPLAAADVARWQAAHAGAAAGTDFACDIAGARLEGVTVTAAPDWITLKAASLAWPEPPMSVRAPRVQCRITDDKVTGNPVLQFEFRDGEVTGFRGWGAIAARLENRDRFGTKIPLDMGGSGSLKIADMTFAQLHQRYLQPKGQRGALKQSEDSRLLTEIHYRYVLAFAALVFVLVGAPAALVMKVSGRMAAFGITLLKVFVIYFPSVIGAKALCASGALDASPEWIPVVLWAGNIVFTILGGLYFFLLHRT